MIRIPPVTLLFKTCPEVVKVSPKQINCTVDSLKDEDPLIQTDQRHICSSGMNGKMEFVLNIFVTEAESPGQVLYDADLSFRMAGEKETLIDQPMHFLSHASNEVPLHQASSQGLSSPKHVINTESAYELIEMLSVDEQLLNMIETFNSFVAEKPQVDHVSAYVERLRKEMDAIPDGEIKDWRLRSAIDELTLMCDDMSIADRKNAIQELNQMLLEATKSMSDRTGDAHREIKKTKNEETN
jgi:hypothetical protein